MKDFFSKIRNLAFKQMPYMASLIYFVKPVENNNIPFAAISNNGTFYYNKEYLSLNENDAVFIMLHEILHLLSDYFGRLGTKNRTIWNVASDMYINDTLETAGMSTNLPLIYPRIHKLPRLKSADFYYEKIINNPDFSMNYNYGKLTIIKRFNEEGDTVFESDENNGKGGDKDENGEGKRLVEDMEIAIRTCGVSIKEYIKQGGNVPSNLVCDIERLFSPPEVDWRRVFRLKVKKTKEQVSAGKSDYNYTKLSRREGDIVFPGLVDKQTSLGILLDTSGSMSKELLEKCLGQVRHIMKYFTNVWFVSIDAKLQTSFKLKSYGDLYKYGKIKGGGGTILTEGFEELKKKEVGVCVAISDLYAQTGEKPDFPVVWMCERGNHGEAPWGKIVEVF